MNTEALVVGAFAVVPTVVFVLLGYRLLRRHVPSSVRVPAIQFAVFWFTLAAVTVISAIESLTAAFFAIPLAVALTLLQIVLLGLCVLLWALLGYLLYIYSGRSPLIALSVLYGLLFVLLLYVVNASQPIGVAVQGGVVSVQDAAPIGGLANAALFAVLILPEFAGSVLYLSLVFRTRDRTVRYRVGLTGASLAAWFGVGSVGIAARVGGGVLGQIVSQSLGVVAAIVILAAYYPPTPVRARFGVRAFDEPAAHAMEGRDRAPPP
jgi:hypothetical protein